MTKFAAAIVAVVAFLLPVSADDTKYTAKAVYVPADTGRTRFLNILGDSDVTLLSRHVGGKTATVAAYGRTSKENLLVLFPTTDKNVVVVVAVRFDRPINFDTKDVEKMVDVLAKDIRQDKDNVGKPALRITEFRAE